jgi:hypothetical protein
MLPDDYREMTHRYINPKEFEIAKSIYRQAAYNKHGDMYLGTVEDVDYLDESKRGKVIVD